MANLDYSSWLKLTTSQREDALQQWDPYFKREGLGVVLCVGGKLAMEKKYVLSVQAGIDHGGIWVLRVHVPQKKFQKLVTPRSDRFVFEGLDVFWATPVVDESLAAASPQTSVSYQNWLSLDEDEQHDLTTGWDLFEREGYGLALHASGRLVQQSDLRIVDVDVFAQNGREWVILACLRQADFSKALTHGDLIDCFEGFNVQWTFSNHYSEPPEG